MTGDAGGGSSLRVAALAVAHAWRDRLDLLTLTAGQLDDLGDAVDLVAIGKAAPEMCRAASEHLGARVRRRFIASETVVDVRPGDVSVAGEHPVPGARSAAAGRRLLSFLDEGGADATVFLVSGGASSLCVAPVPPLTLEDLGALWRHALASGWDVTRLNHARAATSLLGGGAVLRRVRSARSRSLVMVDNVVAGAPWVASALTYEYVPTPTRCEDIARALGDDDARRGRLAAALEHRGRLMAVPPSVAHENRTLVEPGAVADAVAAAARATGWDATSMGAVAGDVESEIERWARVALEPAGRVRCLVGVGEVTVRVDGPGRGGRCQEFVLRAAQALDATRRPWVCAGLATDGRDFLPDVGGAWSESATLSRLRARGEDVGDLLARHDVHDALMADGAVIAGGRTGWNLCDVYLVVIGPSRP